MMTRALLAGLMGGLIALPAFAAPVTVTEYPGMTRIIVPFIGNADWSVKRSPGSIALSGDIVGEALTAPPAPAQGRLSKLDIWRSDTGSGVDITYGCDCTPSLYTNDAREMVIDLKQNAAPAVVAAPALVPATALTRSGPRPAASGGWQARRASTPPAQPRQTEAAAPRAIPKPAPRQESARESAPLAAMPVPRPRPSPPAKATTATISATATKAELEASVAAVRESILMQFDTAAEDGVIILSDNGGVADKPLPAECPDEASLDLERLTDTTHFRKPLPGLRAAVFDDMKQLSPRAVRALSRHYITYGLGAEARNILKAFDVEGDAENTLFDLAAFLEGDYAALKDSALFRKECGPRAAVWRTALAAAEGTGETAALYPLTDGMLFRVPDTLRKIVGAQIALGLFDEGDDERAMRLWRDLQTATGPDTPEMRLLKAHRRLPSAPKETILPALLKLAESREPEAMGAALRAAAILDTVLDNDAAGRLRTALDDLIFAKRSSPQERPLVLARSRLNARYGDLGSALEDLRVRLEEEPGNAEHWQRLIQETIKSAVKQADAGKHPKDFAAILSAQTHLDTSPEADKARGVLARKLIDAGGAHLIDRIITPEVFRRSAEARQIFADALIRRGLADKAMLVLARGNDTESLALKQRIRTIEARDMRTSLQDRFEAMPRATPNAPITHARELLEGSIADLTEIKEIMTDG